MSFYQVEPFGDFRTDLAAANVSSTLANINRDPKTRPQPYDFKDFLPKFQWEEEVPLEATLSQEDLIAKTMRIFSAFGGKVAKKVKGR
jgi:hypothetical protein